MTFRHHDCIIADGDIEDYILTLPTGERAELLRLHLWSMVTSDDEEAIGWLGLALADGEDVQRALVRDMTATLMADWYACGMDRHGGVTSCGDLTYEDVGGLERAQEATDRGAGRVHAYCDGVEHEFIPGAL